MDADEKHIVIYMNFDNKMLADSFSKMSRSTFEYVAVGACVCPCRSECKYARLWVSLESVKTIMQTDTSEMRGWLPGDRHWGGCSRGNGVRCSLNDVWLELRSVRRAQTCLTTGRGSVLYPRGLCNVLWESEHANAHFQGSLLVYIMVHCYIRMNDFREILFLPYCTCVSSFLFL